MTPAEREQRINELYHRLHGAVDEAITEDQFETFMDMCWDDDPGASDYFNRVWRDPDWVAPTLEEIRRLEAMR